MKSPMWWAGIATREQLAPTPNMNSHLLTAFQLASEKYATSPPMLLPQLSWLLLWELSVS